MEQPSNSTETCQHTKTDSITVSDYDWALDREFYVTRTVCLDCGKRVY